MGKISRWECVNPTYSWCNYLNNKSNITFLYSVSNSELQQNATSHHFYNIRSKSKAKIIVFSQLPLLNPSVFLKVGPESRLFA